MKKIFIILLLITSALKAITISDEGVKKIIEVIQNSTITEAKRKQEFATLVNQYVQDQDDAGYILRRIMQETLQDPDFYIGQLMTKKAGINDQSPTGKTPLILAVESNKRWNVDALLSRGAQILIEDDEGKTALDYMQKDNKAMIKLLETAILIEQLNVAFKSGKDASRFFDTSGNINWEWQNNNGYNFLLYYLSHTSDSVEDVKKVIEFLISKNISIDSSTLLRITALDFAIINENVAPEIVAFLIERGADLNKKTVKTSVFGQKNALEIARFKEEEATDEKKSKDIIAHYRAKREILEQAMGSKKPVGPVEPIKPKPAEFDTKLADGLNMLQKQLRDLERSLERI